MLARRRGQMPRAGPILRPLPAASTATRPLHASSLFADAVRVLLQVGEHRGGEALLDAGPDLGADDLALGALRLLLAVGEVPPQAVRLVQHPALRVERELVGDRDQAERLVGVLERGPDLRGLVRGGLTRARHVVEARL